MPITRRIVSSLVFIFLLVLSARAVDAAPTTFALSSSTFIYNGSLQGPTIATTPEAATFTADGTLTAINAGSYTATATATGDYTGSNNSLTWSITKATAGVTLGGLSAAYDTTAHAAWGSPQGVVTTFSGTAGSPGSLDGTGSSALFHAPRDTAMDSAGNIYVADSSNSTIRKITPAGVVTTFAGTALQYGTTDATGSAARFLLPAGVAVDSADNLYVADSGNHIIRKITPAGVVTTFAGLAGSQGSADGTGAAARFKQPEGLAVDSAGNVYVADSYNHTIRKITPAGVVTTLAGLAGSHGSTDDTGSAARFYHPFGLCVDGAGNVYVADTSNYVIRKITPAGVVTTFAGTALSAGTTDATGSEARFYSPYGVEVDAAGNVYVTDNLCVIRKITAAGAVSTLAGDANASGSADGAGAAARFRGPGGLTVDPDGTLYVADTGNNEIRKVTAGGVVTTFAGTIPTRGSADGTGAAARYYGPRDVAVDGAGNVYVTDSGNRTIRKITPAGVATTLAGTPGASGSADGTGSAAQFGTPTGVAVDHDGNVYVADQANQTIRKITPGGIVTTLAGAPGVSGSADGTGSAARFYQPSGLAVDSAGNVYVADYYNYTIRKITPGGVVTTFAGSAGLGSPIDGTGASARFYFPSDVAVDGSDNVYVADGNLVRKITPGAVVTTLAGHPNLLGSADGRGSAARFASATGLTVDGSGNVYVVDSGNDTIRKITPDGLVTTVAGTAGLAASTDGTGSAARFYWPSGVAVDGAGNLYVADTINNTIRKITATSGTITLTYDGASTAPTNVGSYSVVATLTDPNYQGSASGTLVISQGAQAAVRINSAMAVNFGVPYTATATGGSGTGAIVWSLGTGSTAPNPAIDASTGAVTSTGIGTVAIKAYRAADASYLASATANFTLTIFPGFPVITWSAPDAITYGTALNATQLNASADVSGTFVYGPASGTILDVGTQTLSITFHPTDNVNYDPTYVTRTLTVNPAPTTFALSAPTFAYTGVAQSPSIIATPAGATFTTGGTLSAIAPGDYTATAIATGNYTGSNSALNWNIAKASATVTLSGLSAIFDGTPKTVGATTAPTGKTVTFTYDGSPNAPSLPGNYAVVATIDDPNYTGSAPGTLVITDNGPVVTSHSPARNMLSPGDSVMLSVTATATGLPSYKWYHDGREITGATGASLALTSATYADRGAYWVAITNLAGTTRSAPFFVTVAPARTEIVGWGINTAGEINLPSDLTTAVAITAGQRHALALKRDGTVVAWGGNGHSGTTVPTGLSDVVAVAAAGDFSLALKSDGTVVAWGSTTGDLTVPAGLNGVVAISAGGDHALALKTDGSLVQWGYAGSGYYPVPTGSIDAVAIAAGSTSLALKNDGTVVAWGLDFYGSVTNPPAGLSGATAIMSSGHSFAVKSDGTIAVWGGVNTWGEATIPPGLASVVALAGSRHTIALKADGTVAAWGYNSDGQTNVPAGLQAVLSVAAGLRFSLVLRDLTVELAPVITSQTSTRQLLQPGENLHLAVSATGYGALSFQWRHNGRVLSTGVATTGGDSSYTRTSATYEDNGWYVADITDSNGTRHSQTIFVFVAPAPTVVQAWGDNSQGQTSVPAGLTDVVAISAGMNHALALKADGTVAAWGSNVNGATQVPGGLTGVVALDGGQGFSLALESDGTVVGWGASGNNAENPPSGLANVVAISAGNWHSLALKNDGTVVAWGDNSLGQTAVPSNLTNVVGIAAGLHHSLALKSDGTVVGWGSNYAGGLNVPAGLAGVVALSSSNAHILALKADGTVAAWGVETYGETVVPANLTGVVAIWAGEGHSLALKSDGTVVAWGRNNWGQASTPQNLAGIFGVAGGSSFSMVVRAAAADTLPVITAQPASLRVTPGASAVFVITASAVSGSLNYQWERAPWGSNAWTAVADGPSDHGAHYAGAQTLQLASSNALPVNSGTRYRCVVSNGAGSVTSNAATLSVADRPTDFNADGSTDGVWRNPFTGQLVVALMNGTTKQSEMTLSIGSNYTLGATADFNADGKPDTLWQNTTTGERGIYLMNGTTFGAWVALGNFSTAYEIVGAADFNNDGKPDTVWQNTTTGERGIYLMNGTALGNWVALGNFAAAYRIAAVADFNGDGKPDTIWQNITTGERGVYLMNGTSFTSWVPLGYFSTDYRIVGAGDYNADGKADTLWLNTVTGERGLYLMNGTAFTSWVGQGYFTPPVTATVANDFNADGKADTLWQNTVTGERGLFLMNGTSLGSWAPLGNFTAVYDIAAIADFNADGKPDTYWQNKTTGERGIYLMNGTSFTSWVPQGYVPIAYDVVGAADFNGDGKPDTLWQNTSTGERGIYLMNGTTRGAWVALGNFSTNYRIAVVADFNADGKPDTLWQNTVNGECGIYLMNGTALSSWVPLGYFNPNYVIVAAADYNNDGKTDTVWQNTSTGECGIYLMNGTSFTSWVPLGYFSTQYRIAQ